MSLLDYSLCSQTVTLYRLQGDAVLRQVLEGCYYSHTTRETVDEQGRRQQVSCLLIVPGGWEIRLGDRVMEGIGPEVTPQQWHLFTPVNVPTLAQIGYVRPCFLEGSLCHTEAGEK